MVESIHHQRKVSYSWILVVWSLWFGRLLRHWCERNIYTWYQTWRSVWWLRYCIRLLSIRQNRNNYLVHRWQEIRCASCIRWVWIWSLEHGCHSRQRSSHRLWLEWLKSRHWLFCLVWFQRWTQRMDWELGLVPGSCSLMAWIL